MNQQDLSSFDDSKLQQWDMKQTAQFFNPSGNSQPIKFQFKQQVQRVPFKSPKEQAFRIASEANKKEDKRNTMKKSSLTSTKSQLFNQITPVMHKYGSPPKLIKVPSVKPFSPPQPRQEPIKVAQNNSLAPGMNKEFNISMADVQPNFCVRRHYIPQEKKLNIQTPTQPPKQIEYPSYQKSLLDSRQSQMQKSSSTAFLPKINKLGNNMFGYGSIGQHSQQETALRTNSSKQTITPVNEFMNLPNDDIARKSKTAQEHLRDTLESQQAAKFRFAFNDQPQLPQIQSPQGTQQFTSTEGSGKPKKFLQRTPQTKIISRLFSSKSDNNQNQ